MWRWTRQEAALGFRNVKKDATLYLDLDSPGCPYASQEVKVLLGGQLVDTFVLIPTQRVVRKISLPANLMGTEDVAELRLVVDKTFVPPQLNPAEPADPRTLGVRVFNVYIDS